MKFSGRKQRLKSAAIIGACALLSTVNVFAADAPKPSELNNAAAIMLIVVAAALMLAIGMLGYVLIGAAEFYVARLKEKAKGSSSTVKTLAIAGLCLLTSAAFAVKVTRRKQHSKW
jgi:fluoride ion exporter CrcB/FEX